VAELGGRVRTAGVSIVKVTLVPSAVGETGEEQRQFLTSYIINDRVAIDAGCLGFYRTPEEQAGIKHVFITHSHIDHIASLPILVENVYDGNGDGVNVYASEPVLATLRTDLFNERIWPDFIALSKNTDKPFLTVHTIEPGRPIELEGLRITGIPVHHVVPTLGFIIDDGKAAIAISSDTGPTEELWKRASAQANLRAVFLEVTFPEHMAALAELSAHLTPAKFGKEIGKLKKQVPVLAVHIKARFRAQVIAELKALGLPNIQIAKFGSPYSF
jgi:ribonuclease BN (tRNA processing enzyme)